MIEKIAQELYEADHYRWYGDNPDKPVWALAGEDEKDRYRTLARVASKAMRTPTDEMYHADPLALHYYQGMIDAALGGSEMKISMDKGYQTIDGRKVTIYAINGKGKYPIHGSVDGQMHTWTTEGCYGGSHLESNTDLIEKPKTVDLDFWINVYPDGFDQHVGIHPSREIANLRSVKDQRIACINIKRTVAVGEWL